MRSHAAKSLLLALLALPWAACGGDSSSSTTTAAAPTGTEARATTRAATPPPIPPPARVGQSVVRSASSGTAPGTSAAGPVKRRKTKLRIRVLGVLDPLPTNSLTETGLRKGQRYVAVRLELKNVGRAAWSDAPSGISTLVSTRGQQAPKATGLLGGPCGGFQDRVELAPGDSQRGCVNFILYRPAKGRIFQFSPDYPATAPAQWLLIRPKRRPKPASPPTTTSTAPAPAATTPGSTPTSTTTP